MSPEGSGEDAAVTVVRDALLGPQSLAARLRVDEPLARELAARLLEALEVLTHAWSSKPAVPKRLVLAFLDVQRPLRKAAASRAVSERNGVEDLGVEILDAVSELLTTDLDAAPPADRILYDGLMTGTSLPYKLRMGRGVDRGQLNDLRVAFEDAIRYYRGQDEISKTLALACVDLPCSMDQGFNRHDAAQKQEIAAARAMLMGLARTLVQAGPP